MFLRLVTPKVSAAIVLTGALLMVIPATAQVVGKAAAVNPSSTGGGRTLSIGAEVIHNERILNDSKGSQSQQGRSAPSARWSPGVD
jgi:hypothetical protein